MADTLRHNPRIDEADRLAARVVARGPGRRLRAERWTHRLDLHGSLRSHAAPPLVGGRWTSYPEASNSAQAADRDPRQAWRTARPRRRAVFRRGAPARCHPGRRAGGVLHHRTAAEIGAASVPRRARPWPRASARSRWRRARRTSPNDGRRSTGLRSRASSSTTHDIVIARRNGRASGCRRRSVGGGGRSSRERGRSILARRNRGTAQARGSAGRR